MATFVLLHGAWEAGWIFAPLERDLRARGHEVFRPTLTGLGERAHLATPAVDLETHVADVLGVLSCEDLRNVTLLGHSYGGMVAGIAADRAADRIGALIYLDAFIPEDGKSMFDLVTPARAAEFETMAAAGGEGWRIPVLPAKDWGVSDHAHVRMLDALSVPHPIATMRQRLRLGGRGAPKSAYVLCTGREPTPFPAQAAKARASGWPVVELPTHHFPMLSMPRETADILVRLAA